MLAHGFALLASLSFLFACTRHKAPVHDVEESDAPAITKSAAADRKSERDPHFAQIVKLSLQADQIVREAWWVVANDRPATLRSPFGKLQRAASQAMDGKLSSKGFFECDHYAFAKEAVSEWSGTFSEDCGRAGTKEIARWTFLAKDPEAAGRASVLFFPANLREVIGMSASLFGSRVECELSWNEKGLVETLSCPHWQQDRGNQLVKLETFEYQREGGALLRLRGQVLENLQPVRKLDAKVPLEGKITVVETELVPTPAAPPVAAPASKTSSVRGAGAAAQPGAAGVVAGAPAGAAGLRPAKKSVVPPTGTATATPPAAPAAAAEVVNTGEIPTPQIDPSTGLPMGSVVLPNGDVWIPNATPAPPPPLPVETPTPFAPAAPAPTTDPSRLAEPDYLPSGSSDRGSGPIPVMPPPGVGR